MILLAGFVRIAVEVGGCSEGAGVEGEFVGGVQVYG